MKKLFFFLLLLGGAAGGGYWWWQEQQHLKQAGPRRPVTAKLDMGDVTEKVSATGKVAPKEKILVSTDVPLGIVTQLNPDAEPGKVIKAGTWLVKLDDAIAVAKLKEAEAAMDTAKAARDAAVAKKEAALVGVDLAKIRSEAAKSEFDKQISILGPNAPPGQVKAAQDKLKEAAQGIKFAESEVSAAEAAIKTAEANMLRAQTGITLAKKGVDMMTIVAPRDGIVLEKKVLFGQPVSPQNSPLFIMMPTGDDWEVYALVSESDIGKVQKDQNVEFRAEAYAGKNVRYRGKVLKKDLMPTQLASSTPIGLGLVGPTNFGITVTVAHDATLDKDFPLLAGMTANVDVMVNSVKNVLRLPKSVTQYQPAAISKEDRDRIDAAAQEQWQPIWVWTKADKAELVFIKTGVDDGSYVEVKEVQTGPNVPTLQPGVEVVVEDPPQEEKSGGLFGGKPLNIPIR